MTPKDHKAKSAQFEAELTARRAAVPKLESLADKIAAKRAIKQREEQFRQHRLNYFELTRDTVILA